MKLKKLIVASVLSLSSIFAIAAPVDINSANAESIAKVLRGVGPTKAAAIVKYRETNGKFRSADDLTKVKGIGKKTIDANRSNIVVAADK